MDFNRQISRRLHEEHEATLALWNRFEQAAGARSWTPEVDLIRHCAAALAEEISHHFAFEETELFPRLAEAGEGDIAELLTEEHAAIRAAAQAFSAALEAEDWRQLKTSGLELSERLVELVSVPSRVEVVATAATEDEALAACDRYTISLAIVDLQLAQGTGFGVIRRLRAAAGANPACIVVLTNHAVPALKGAAFEAGGEDCLEKTTDVCALPRRVQAATPGRAA